MNENKKVPMAILSCFLILFIIQGILKISGVFIFEKALDWEIFKIIDSNKPLMVGYYVLLNYIASYCLSFALTTKAGSKNFFHNILILGGSYATVSCRFFITTPLYMEFVYDIINFIAIPCIINFTTKKKYKMDVNPVITISLQILLYFVYLGLSYWSNLLASLLPISQSVLPASTNFLIQIELYIGLVLLTLSLNLFIKKETIK